MAMACQASHPAVVMRPAHPPLTRAVQNRERQRRSIDELRSTEPAFEVAAIATLTEPLLTTWSFPGIGEPKAAATSASATPRRAHRAGFVLSERPLDEPRGRVAIA
jgi:hypothetical protein